MWLCFQLKNLAKFAVEGMVEESWVVWPAVVDTGGSADVVIVHDDCVVWTSVIDSGEVAVDVMVDE